MDLEQALAKIKELEGQVEGLQKEKTALIAKRDELLETVVKAKDLKKFEPYKDVDIEELIRIRDAYKQGDEQTRKKYEDLYNADRSKLETRIAQIEKERQEEKQQREKEKQQLAAEKLKAAAILEFSNGEHRVHSPKQLFSLIGNSIRYSEAGELVVGDEYKSIALKDHLKELQNDPEFANQFKATGASGSGALPGQGGSGAPQANPFKRETWNLTEQGKLVKTNPTLAARLKTEAGVK